MRNGLLMLFVLALLAGCQSRTATVSRPAVARFLLESEATRTAEVTLPVSGVRLRVLPKPVILEYDIVSVELAQVELGRCLLFQLAPDAARDLYRMTAVNQGRRLALLINDQPMGARVIDQPLPGGMILVFCEVPDAELPGLVERLKQTTAELRSRRVSSGQKVGACLSVRRALDPEPVEGQAMDWGIRALMSPANDCDRGRSRSHSNIACKQAPTSCARETGRHS